MKHGQPYPAIDERRARHWLARQEKGWVTGRRSRDPEPLGITRDDDTPHRGPREQK